MSTDELPLADDLEAYLIAETSAVAIVRGRMSDTTPWRTWAALSVVPAGPAAWHLRVLRIRSWGADTAREHAVDRERLLTLPRTDVRITWLRPPAELREALA